jgi:hypothetical protein
MMGELDKLRKMAQQLGLDDLAVAIHFVQAEEGWRGAYCRRAVHGRRSSTSTREA